MASYTYLWEFIVEPDHLDEFRRHYGHDGSWAALFRRATGYMGTLLLQDRSNPRRFITMDRWESPEAFGLFCGAFAKEYAELDARCDQLTEREVSLGEFNL
jgi:heme-degrading monooxygenase HmoA